MFCNISFTSGGKLFQNSLAINTGDLAIVSFAGTHVFISGAMLFLVSL